MGRDSRSNDDAGAHGLSKSRSNSELSSPSAETPASSAAAVPAEKLQSNVAVLLGTYFGQNHLAAQLDSIASQTHPNWAVWASDDDSRDTTLTILNSYRERWGPYRLAVRTGPRKGFATNFLSLACCSEIKAEYYAFSDQDDVWDATKLEKALSWLQQMPADIPALYCSRTRLIDDNDNEIGLSPLFEKPPSFRNALVQNIGGGNTMVFNAATRALLAKAGADIGIVSHDWWAYILVSGCGGNIFYDPKPAIRYRQHAKNLVGTNNGLRAKLRRIQQLWRGRFRGWTDANVRALARFQDLLTEENQRVLDTFNEARKRRFLMRAWGIWKSGVTRQTLAGNLGILAAALFNKI